MSVVKYIRGDDVEELYCPACKMLNHVSDFVWCPYFTAYICSYCCMSNRECRTICHRTEEPQGHPLPEKPLHAALDKLLEAK